MNIQVTINGASRTWSIEPHELLLDTLRRYGYLSVKKGCDSGSCGVCTVLINDKPVNSCSIFAAKVDGSNIVTVEGVQAEAEKIGAYMVDEGVDQCGFCSPGFVLTVLGLQKELKNPTEDDILHYLSGNLCRCTGYVGQARAIHKYLKESK
ncbi:(2Fe-2S)-binding protein [bacterium]|nr:(2Fe-2S)-binding protein [bacterium]